MRLYRSRAREEDVRNLIRSRDPAMEAVIRRVVMAAQVNSNVVISGESGTGKELVARALHECGLRNKGPFIAFNCAALPETLLESELFGYIRGAFTDAKESKPGLFARAHGGTLFLDEIGDAPQSIQMKLLRVLQEREIMPLGSTVPVRIDVRLIAATHRSLSEEVAQGRFRQDLFYRLHVLPIHIPPLRERPKDILFLADLFAGQIARQMELSFDGFTPEAEAAMTQHAWPGNVRELQNRIEHAVVVCRGYRIPPKSLFPEMEEVLLVMNPTKPEEAPLIENDSVPTFFEAKESFERNYFMRVLKVAQGNIAKAARLASKSRTEVYNMLKKHRLNPAMFKVSARTKP